jgi:SH3-like domain-containing protein
MMESKRPAGNGCWRQRTAGAAAFVVLMVLATGTAMAERLAVTAAQANIRQGPGTDYDIIWNAEQYYPFEVVNRSGSWILFEDFEGDRGWIHDSLVGKMPTVITKRPKCNIRSGPGTRHDIVFTVEDAVPFKVIRRQGNWLNVEHADGDRGWIHQSLVW